MFTVYGDHMELDDTGTQLRISRETAYGNMKIIDKYKSIYSCDIELTYIAVYDTFVGIDSLNKRFIHSGFYKRIGHRYYAFSPSALKTSCVEHKVIKPFGEKMVQGDIVRMEINTNDKTTKVYINGEDLGNSIWEYCVWWKYISSSCVIV